MTTLENLGWDSSFFGAFDFPARPARLSAIHRSRLEALTDDGSLQLVPSSPAGEYAVGDWVLATGDIASPALPRKSEILRRAAGIESRPQLIAANVDTLAIVTSCNDDFNIPRLERYLALASQSGCQPLIVLTKVDKSADASSYLTRAQSIAHDIPVLGLNAKNAGDADKLAKWCSDGQTLALLGSSGVGKTTLQNALTGTDAATQDIRADDSRGRHTTTYRALRPTVFGGWLIDTPGMRELRLIDAEEGIEDVFSDVFAFAEACKFRDCAHETEPGCAVRAAIDSGALDAGRVQRWRKLQTETQIHTETTAERRSRSKNREQVYKHGKARGRFKRGE